MTNQLYCGDNLSIMQDMPSESVDLIATDPPFNTNRHWGAFDDRFGGLDNYIAFMKERVIEMRRLLKDTGSLYLHCDPTASHYLKVMLDTIFGINQFRNEIVWCYSNCGRPKRFFPKKHDAIYLYTKTDNATWTNTKIPYSEHYIATHFSKDSMRYRKERNGKVYTYHAEDGMIPNDWWYDIPAYGQNPLSDRNGYPTQKPVALYQRIIKASSNQHDIVLDPFCGSGTTLDAAQSLDRHWIGIDQNPDAIAICEKRLNPPQGRLF